MAGRNDCNGITSIGRTDGSRGLRISDLVRELAVGPSLSKWNSKKCLPHLLLKGGASHVQRNSKRLPLSSEVFLEFSFSFNQHWMLRVFRELVKANSAWSFLLPEDRDETFVAGDQF